MRALSVPELLKIWEQGLLQSPVERALTALSLFCPGLSHQELSSLSIGQRDSLLLSLREWIFGSQLVSVIDCPNCGEPLELNFNVTDIRVSFESYAQSELSIDVNDYTIQFRLPNSSDLKAIQSQDAAIAERALLERCVLVANYGEAVQTFSELPDEILDRIVEQMALADPQADIRLSVTCPSCNHAWKSVFDIVSYFWEELNVWAIRLLREVHILASSYGWHEADILAMHPYRRQLYLEMVGR